MQLPSNFQNFGKSRPKVWFACGEGQLDMENITVDQTTFSSPEISTLRIRSKLSRRIHQLLTNNFGI